MARDAVLLTPKRERGAIDLVRGELPFANPVCAVTSRIAAQWRKSTAVKAGRGRAPTKPESRSGDTERAAELVKRQKADMTRPWRKPDAIL
jgi:hypothetical protein